MLNGILSDYPDMWVDLLLLMTKRVVHQEIISILI